MCWKYAIRPVAAVARNALRGRAFPPRSLSAMTACSAVESLQRTLRRADACPAPRLAGGARTQVHAAGLMRYVNRVRTATACFRRRSCRTFGRRGRLGCAARPQRMRCTRVRDGATRLAVGGPRRLSPCPACKIFVRLPACIILPRAARAPSLGPSPPCNKAFLRACCRPLRLESALTGAAGYKVFN